MRSIIIPYVSRHCGLLNEISRVCGSFWYMPVTAVMSSTGPEIFIVAYFLPISLLLPLCSVTLRFPTPITPHTNRCVPIWCLLSFSRSQPSFSPGNSRVLSEETSCPTTQRPPLLAPWVFGPIFPPLPPITFHPALWMPRTSATPSGQQTRQEKMKE